MSVAARMKHHAAKEVPRGRFLRERVDSQPERQRRLLHSFGLPTASRPEWSASPRTTVRPWTDDYVNLIAKYQGPFAYSFVFDGQAGYLDHALASPHLARRIAGVDIWHINSDEALFLDVRDFEPQTAVADVHDRGGPPRSDQLVGAPRDDRRRVVPARHVPRRRTDPHGAAALRRFRAGDDSVRDARIRAEFVEAAAEDINRLADRGDATPEPSAASQNCEKTP